MQSEKSPGIAAIPAAWAKESLDGPGVLPTSKYFVPGKWRQQSDPLISVLMTSPIST